MNTPPAAAPRLIFVNRDQLIMTPLDVEKLIADDHPARAIWEFVGNLNLEAYMQKIGSIEGMAGRPAYDPRLLISLWVYACSDGVGSAREIERLCGYHPAYQWLTGMEQISHHTLSNFRIEHQVELDELFTQILGLLSAANLVTLDCITQDGMKVKAFAGTDSFRREETIRKHLELARAQVAAMGDPRQDPSPENKRNKKARERAATERQKRLEQALEELSKIQASKKTEKKRKEARVSETDPEARIMKHGDGGYAPSYNVQISADAANGIIVNVDISQCATDSGELMGPVGKVEERTGTKPRQVVADGGFTTRANILSMETAKIDFVGSFSDRPGVAAGQYERHGIAVEFRNDAFRYDEAENKYICPAGEDLRYVGKGKAEIGVSNFLYRANAEICGACLNREKCCPGENVHGRNLLRSVEASAIVEFKKKMETDEAKKRYRTRGPIAEFPHAWIKEKFGLRKFRLLGKEKSKQEALWACITYNIQQWIRLVWRPKLAAATG